MRTIQGKWVTEPEYRSVLFFTQALDEMVWEEAREIYRIPALNTYHRCLELIGAASEIFATGLPHGILDPMFEELLYLAERDPVVKRYYRDQFGQLQSLCKNTSSYPARVSTVKLFFSKIRSQYLRNCRHLIEDLINENVVDHNSELYISIGIFASYLLNEGVSALYIANCIRRHFLIRTLSQKRVREIQDFFSYFPTASSRFDVHVRVTSSLKDLVIGSGAAKAARTLAGGATTKRSRGQNDLVVFEGIEARDFLSARMKCESILATARAVAYTVAPHSDVGWLPEITVRSEDGTDRSTEAMTHALRQRHKVIQKEVERLIELRNRVLLRKNVSDQDRNRLTNSLLAYANAFHSEHPSTQLVALWFSVEALLPSPPSDEIRIRAFARDIVAAQRRLYLKHVFLWLFVDFLRMYNEAFLRILDEVKGYGQRVSQFTACLCFPEYSEIGKKLFELANGSPLAQQRGLVLHRAAKNCGDLYGLVENHCRAVEWQLHRIYRERNRIAHQANPSQNVSTLVTNINEYYLGILETFFDEAEVNDGLPFDELLWRIRLEEQFRAEAIGSQKKENLTKTNAELVLGYRL